MTIEIVFVNLMRRFCLALCAGCLSLPAVAQDADNGQKSWHFNAFGTLGLLHNSNNFDGSFRREVSQPFDPSPNRANVDSRFGVQANYTINTQLEWVGQAVLKDRVLSNRPKDAVEWAFLAYRPEPDLTVRIGRTSPDLFLLSDYRNVGFGYAPIRPPVDFYSMLPIAAIDGIDAAKTWTAGDAQWRVKAFAGKSAYRVANKATGNQQGDLDGSFGMNVAREQDGLLLRATLARSKLSFRSTDIRDVQTGLNALTQLPMPLVATQASELQSAITFLDKRITYAALGAAYERNAWLLSAEGLRLQSDFTPAVISAGYMTVGRRFGNFTLHTTVSGVRAHAKVLAIPQWEDALAPLAPILGATAPQQAQALGAAAVTALNTLRVDQKTVSIGMRWEFDPRMAFKWQWDHTRVASNGGLVWGGRASGGLANVGSIALDFVF